MKSGTKKPGKMFMGQISMAALLMPPGMSRGATPEVSAAGVIAKAKSNSPKRRKARNRRYDADD